MVPDGWWLPALPPFQPFTETLVQMWAGQALKLGAETVLTEAEDHDLLSL